MEYYIAMKNEWGTVLCTNIEGLIRYIQWGKEAKYKIVLILLYLLYKNIDFYTNVCCINTRKANNDYCTFREDSRKWVDIE